MVLANGQIATKSSCAGNGEARIAYLEPLLSLSYSRDRVSVVLDLEEQYVECKLSGLKALTPTTASFTRSKYVGWAGFAAAAVDAFFGGIVDDRRTN